MAALREYAEDWNDRLHQVANHTVHRPVVELVELSTDEQLRSWLLGAPASEPPADPGDGPMSRAAAG